MTSKSNKIEQETLSNDKISGNAENLQVVATQASLDSLRTEVIKLDKDLTEAKNNFEKSRFDLITILGLFVGFITYLGLQIQVFKTIPGPLLIIGVSIFFMASILLFVLTANVILKKLGTIMWKDFFNPLYLILIFLFAISIFFVVYGHHDYLKHKILYDGESIKDGG